METFATISTRAVAKQMQLYLNLGEQKGSILRFYGIFLGMILRR